MFLLNQVDDDFLTHSVQKGEAFLVLGAGASMTSQNAQNEDIKNGDQLAAALVREVGRRHAGETLTEVLNAIYPQLLSDQQLLRALTREYLKCRPSDDLKFLLSHVWKRIYTWNIDDTLENITVRGAQIRHHYNGLVEKVFLYNDVAHVEIVHLHGQVSRPEAGFILTETEYNARLANDRHDWYRRLTQDYVAHVPIFIGSKLKEPILSLELDRARGQERKGLGRAYLVSPDDFTSLQQEGLASRNIVHLKGTLGDFCEWLSGKFGGSVSVKSAARAASEFVDEILGRVELSEKDLEILKGVYPVRWGETLSRWKAKKATDVVDSANRFLRGFPPTWALAASDVPVRLAATDGLKTALDDSISRRDRLFVVTGQSGSGKTTAIMQVLLELSQQEDAPPIYELGKDVKSLRSALRLLERIHPDQHVIVYVVDAFLYGDALGEDAAHFAAGRFTIVASARSGEWSEHLARRCGGIARTYVFERFGETDYGPLIERLEKFVPAPKFMKLTQDQKRKALAKSNSQLLIALREATESRRFTQVITAEYEAIKCCDAKRLLLLVGVATLARVGIAKEAAREAYAHLGCTRSFDEAVTPLEGIVSVDKTGRMFARHELYVRHIIENVAPLEDTIECVVAILNTFTKYRTPITHSVGRRDGNLFRFLLGHNFLFDLCDRRGYAIYGTRVYEEFEVEFQLDGHYWLQYGQYFVEMGDPEAAMPILHKSIQAYPDSIFAWHAYADVQLRVARLRPTYDSVTVELIGDAVRILREQDASPDLQTERYAIVTLALGHVGALVKHGQLIPAHEYAKEYYERVSYLEKRLSDAALRVTRERLTRFLLNNEWEDVRSARRSKRRR